MTPELYAIFILFFLVILNGLFSMSEMAVVSSRKQKLRAKADEGHATYRAVLELAQSPTAFLSTIQIGITLVGILAGAYGEDTIASSLREYFRSIPWLAEYARVLSTGIVVVAITFVSILAGELIPKRIALGNPERIAALIVYPMKALSTALMPVVRVFTWTTNRVMDMLAKRDRGREEPPITGEEIKVLIREGEAFGLFVRQQAEMAKGVFDLHENRISSIMSPRPDIRYVELTESAKKIRERIIELGAYAYLPVCKNGLDNVVGVIKTREVLTAIIKGEYKTIKRHIRKPVYAPESISPLKVLELLKSNKSHIAFTIDEYGGVTGLVTLHDVIEEIVGDVPEASDAGEPKITARRDGSFLVDGMISVDDFLEHFGQDISGSGDYNTLAGFVIERLGRIPGTGETLEFGDYGFEIVDLDGNRVDKVLVKRLDDAPRRPAS